MLAQNHAVILRPTMFGEVMYKSDGIPGPEEGPLCFKGLNLGGKTKYTNDFKDTGLWTFLCNQDEATVGAILSQSNTKPDGASDPDIIYLDKYKMIVGPDLDQIFPINSYQMRQFALRYVKPKKSLYFFVSALNPGWIFTGEKVSCIDIANNKGQHCYLNKYLQDVVKDTWVTLNMDALNEAVSKENICTTGTFPYYRSSNIYSCVFFK